MTSLDETPVLQRMGAACRQEEGVRSPAHLGGLAWDLNQHLNKLDEVTVWTWDSRARRLDGGAAPAPRPGRGGVHRRLGARWTGEALYRSIGFAPVRDRLLSRPGMFDTR